MLPTRPRRRRCVDRGQRPAVKHSPNTMRRTPQVRLRSCAHVLLAPFGFSIFHGAVLTKEIHGLQGWCCSLVPARSPPSSCLHSPTDSAGAGKRAQPAALHTPQYNRPLRSLIARHGRLDDGRLRSTPISSCKVRLTPPPPYLAGDSMR